MSRLRKESAAIDRAAERLRRRRVGRARIGEYTRLAPVGGELLLPRAAPPASVTWETRKVEP